MILTRCGKGGREGEQDARGAWVAPGCPHHDVAVNANQHENSVGHNVLGKIAVGCEEAEGGRWEEKKEGRNERDERDDG
jgi:hypothetical protein